MQKRNVPYNSRNSALIMPRGVGRLPTHQRIANITRPSRIASYSMLGWRGSRSGAVVGNTMPHGRSVGLPHSSPLMKLPIRPVNRPIGTSTAVKSATSKYLSFCMRAKTPIATSTPSRPTWNDMPPCQTRLITSGSEPSSQWPRRDRRRVGTGWSGQCKYRWKPNTADEIRIIDWSSDVCSSDLGRLAPQFAVDEVADTAGEQADRHQHRGKVGNLEILELLHAREHAHRDQHAEQTAVERHAALPDANDHQRIGRRQPVASRIVGIEQHVADAPTKDHAHHDVKQQVGHAVARPVDVRQTRAAKRHSPDRTSTRLKS